jgi:hypothetical protein
MGLGPIASNDLLSVRAHTPVTRCSLRLGTRVGSPVGGAPISPTAAWQGPEVSRVASTSTETKVRHRAGSWLRPLGALRPPVPHQLPQTAPGPSATCAPPPPCPGAAAACPRHHSARDTNHSGPSPAANAPNATPTPWPSSAPDGSPPSSSRVLGHAPHFATASAFSPLSLLPPDASARRASRQMPSRTTRPH